MYGRRDRLVLAFAGFWAPRPVARALGRASATVRRHAALRQSPSLDAPTVGYLRRGEELPILAYCAPREGPTNGRPLFYRVRSPRLGDGWIQTSDCIARGDFSEVPVECTSPARARR